METTPIKLEDVYKYYDEQCPTEQDVYPSYIIDFVSTVPYEEALIRPKELEILKKWCLCNGVSDHNKISTIQYKELSVCECYSMNDFTIKFISFTIHDVTIKTAIKFNDWTNFISNLRVYNSDYEIPKIDNSVRAFYLDLMPELLLNPITLDSISENSSRFSSAVWYNEIQNKRIILAGLGGIGSYTAFLLGRMNPEVMFLYDNDIVEYANLSGQLFCINNVGNLKTTAISELLENYSNYYSVCEMGLYTADSETSDIMICGFDSMLSRKVFYHNWKEHVNSKPEDERKHCLFIDGRLAAEDFQVFCITGDNTNNMIKYEEFLFNDKDADNTICSYKQTSYVAAMIGSIIANLFTNFVSNECYDACIRELPFLVEYDASTMYFKLNNDKFKIE